MTWETFGIAAVALILPYLTKAGEAIATKLGQDMYNWLKGQFEAKNDEDAILIMKSLENDPKSELRGKLLAETISQRASKNPDDFGNSLKDKIQDVQQEGGYPEQLLKAVVANQENIIAGKVSIVNVVGTVHGGIHL